MRRAPQSACPALCDAMALAGVPPVWQARPARGHHSPPWHLQCRENGVHVGATPPAAAPLARQTRPAREHRSPQWRRLHRANDVHAVVTVPGAAPLARQARPVQPHRSLPWRRLCRANDVHAGASVRPVAHPAQPVFRSPHQRTARLRGQRPLCGGVWSCVVEDEPPILRMGLPAGGPVPSRQTSRIGFAAFIARSAAPRPGSHHARTPR